MSEEKNATIEEIIENQKKNYKNSDSALIQRAYDFANSYHEGQLRKSGEPYLIHPLNVAYILSTLELDDETICAALLHDIVEDTPVTNEDLKREFGDAIAEMVAGVTKLGTLRYTSAEEQQVLSNGKRYKSYLNKISR